tara:strand:- start:364 stop:1578 length:1215 start_codon:yes stop_codon:yes gene_type:complete
MYDVLIIGFGVSGISFVKYLKQFTNYKYIVIEKRDTYGGIWNDALNSTTLQTHKNYYQYNDFKMPENYPNHPSKHQILEYLGNVINFYKLDNVIYNHNVLKTKNNKTHWELKIKNNNNNKIIKIKSNYLIICNGLYSSKKKIALNNFKGKIIHISNIKNYNLNIFNNKNITIIGNGASACDFLNAIKDKNSKIYLLYKKDKYFIKKIVFYISTSIILNKYILLFFKKIPLQLYLVLFKIANILLFNNFLNIPKEKVNSKNLIASTIIPELIYKNKLIYLKDTIKYCKSNHIILKNSILFNIDYIILCNGYDESYNFLKDNNKFVYRYKQIINPFLNNVAFIGHSASYNWLINSYNQSKWYIDNIILKKIIISQQTMFDEIKKHKNNNKKNNLDYKDLTYELFNS